VATKKPRAAANFALAPFAGGCPARPTDRSLWFGLEQLAAVVVHSPVYNVTATHFFCAPFSHIIFCSFASWYSITFDRL